jgi:hypothetical protein
VRSRGENEIGTSGPSLVDAHELSLENECGLGGDHAASAGIPISELWGNGECPLFANAHAFYALIPARNNLPCTKLERQWGATVVPVPALPALLQFSSIIPFANKAQSEALKN